MERSGPTADNNTGGLASGTLSGSNSSQKLLPVKVMHAPLRTLKWMQGETPTQFLPASSPPGERRRDTERKSYRVSDSVHTRCSFEAGDGLNSGEESCPKHIPGARGDETQTLLMRQGDGCVAD